MNFTRRELLAGAAALGLGSTLASPAILAREHKPMKLLILGGTGFISPHLVEQAIAHGHEVTIFNRGRSNTHLFPDVKKLVGDRDGTLDALQQGEWDAVLDIPAMCRAWSGDSAQLRKGRVVRTYRGGDVLAPGNPQAPATFIDVRDFAGFSLHLLEQDAAGTYNAAGPAGLMSFGGMLAGIRATRNVPVRFHWMDAAFLARHQVAGNELPMWMDREDPAGSPLVENQSSIDRGVAFRPLAQTAADTLAWHLSLPAAQQPFTRAGLDPAKEKKVLAAWAAR